MTEQDYIQELKKEGFQNVQVVHMDAETFLDSHTHNQITAHVILSGELTTEDSSGVQIFKPGDKVFFPAGTTHTARIGNQPFSMIVGFK